MRAIVENIGRAKLMKLEKNKGEIAFTLRQRRTWRAVDGSDPIASR